MSPFGLVAALLLPLIGACAPLAGFNPVEGPLGPAASISQSEEISGEQDGLLARKNAYVAADKARIERVGRRLLAAIPEHPRIQFLLARRDPSINAGATFRRVMITGGMLRFLESDDELAVVLGHEAAHITQGHVLKGTLASLALSAITIIAEISAPGAGRLASSIGQLFLNHYTQAQEREADEVGLRYASSAGYDPRAAVDMTERLAIDVPQWMSAGYFASHPSSVERAVFATRETDDVPSGAEPTGEVATDSKAVAEVATESTVTAEIPLVVVDEGEPAGESGFTYAPGPIVIVPFFTGHHHRDRLHDPSGRVMRDRVIRNPVPPRPHPARSSIHTRVVR